MGGSLASQKKKMFVPIRNHYWSAQAPVQAVLSSQIKEILLGGKLIVDVGGGLNPWQHATELVDIRNSSNKESRPVRLVDIDSEPLPYGDKQVDFIYSRHTLEDLHNPLLLCRFDFMVIGTLHASSAITCRFPCTIHPPVLSQQERTKEVLSLGGGFR